MRRLPAPLSVTRPPPSSTTCELVFRTFAVLAMVIVTGFGPQSNVMIPPAATAFTTAAEVQLAAVPLPTVRVGLLVSTALAAAGTDAFPSGLPGLGSFSILVADGDAETDADGVADPDGADPGADVPLFVGTGKELTRPVEPPL